MASEKRWQQKPQEQELRIVAQSRVWIAIQIYALFQFIQVIAAWIPAVTTLIGVAYLLQQTAEGARCLQESHITAARQPSLRNEKHRRRQLRKSEFGSKLHLHRSFSARFRKAQRRHRPETESPSLSVFLIYLHYFFGLVERELSSIIADPDLLLSALPGFIPPATEGVTSSSISLNPTQQFQTTESHPSQQQGDRTPSTSYL